MLMWVAQREYYKYGRKRRVQIFLNLNKNKTQQHFEWIHVDQPLDTLEDWLKLPNWNSTGMFSADPRPLVATARSCDSKSRTEAIQT